MSKLLNVILYSNNKKSKIKHEQEKILKYLKELEKLEAKLWGTDIKNLKHGEETVLEDSNHLIHLIANKKYDTLKKILELKDTKKILNDIFQFKNDFNILKKELREKETLKLFISNFTIKLVDAKNYNKFKNVFLIEKHLYEVLDVQDNEFNILLNDLSKIKIKTTDEKIETFLSSLKKIRAILSGHLDNYKHFEEERLGYSNTSNLIFELIKTFSQDLD
ncbi:MAG: hypothetical protein ACOC16_01420 [Nanoarchaeota archaeon]